MADPAVKVGIIGARGYVGAELIRLILDHPGFELVFVSSREYAGATLASRVEGVESDLCYEHIAPAELAGREFDVCVLALPNGLAASFVEVIDGRGDDPVLVDVSADYRFDPDWYYGLPELTRAQCRGARRISNPGCYATAMQLAIAPMLDLVDAPPQCFGVSGYSGAGTTPSPKNDPEVLRDNLLPYAPVGHLHQREVSHHLDQAVRFTPHVAAFFRGITMTVAMTLGHALSEEQVWERYRQRYVGEPLVRLSRDIPRVADNAGRHHAVVGGQALGEGGRYLVTFCTLDNLLKGAATQALQNMNLACGFPELEGIPHD